MLRVSRFFLAMSVLVLAVGCRSGRPYVGEGLKKRIAQENTPPAVAPQYTFFLVGDAGSPIEAGR